MEEKFQLLEDYAKLKALIEAHKAGQPNKEVTSKSTQDHVSTPWDHSWRPWHSHRFHRPPPHIARAMLHGGRGGWFGRPPWAFRGPRPFDSRMHAPWMKGMSAFHNEIGDGSDLKTSTAQGKTETVTKKQPTKTEIDSVKNIIFAHKETEKHVRSSLYGKKRVTATAVEKKAAVGQSKIFGNVTDGGKSRDNPKSNKKPTTKLFGDPAGKSNIPDVVKRKVVGQSKIFGDVTDGGKSGHKPKSNINPTTKLYGGPVEELTIPDVAHKKIVGRHKIFGDVTDGGKSKDKPKSNKNPATKLFGEPVQESNDTGVIEKQVFGAEDKPLVMRQLASQEAKKTFKQINNMNSKEFHSIESQGNLGVNLKSPQSKSGNVRIVTPKFHIRPCFSGPSVTLSQEAELSGMNLGSSQRSNMSNPGIILRQASCEAKSSPRISSEMTDYSHDTAGLGRIAIPLYEGPYDGQVRQTNVLPFQPPEVTSDVDSSSELLDCLQRSVRAGRHASKMRVISKKATESTNRESVQIKVVKPDWSSAHEQQMFETVEPKHTETENRDHLVFSNLTKPESDSDNEMIAKPTDHRASPLRCLRRSRFMSKSSRVDRSEKMEQRSLPKKASRSNVLPEEKIEEGTALLMMARASFQNQADQSIISLAHDTKQEISGAQPASADSDLVLNMETSTISNSSAADSDQKDISESVTTLSSDEDVPSHPLKTFMRNSKSKKLNPSVQSYGQAQRYPPALMACRMASRSIKRHEDEDSTVDFAAESLRRISRRSSKSHEGQGLDMSFLDVLAQRLPSNESSPVERETELQTSSPPPPTRRRMRCRILARKSGAETESQHSSSRPPISSLRIPKISQESAIEMRSRASSSSSPPSRTRCRRTSVPQISASSEPLPPEIERRPRIFSSPPPPSMSCRRARDESALIPQLLASCESLTLPLARRKKCQRKRDVSPSSSPSSLSSSLSSSSETDEPTGRIKSRIRRRGRASSSEYSHSEVSLMSRQDKKIPGKTLPTSEVSKPGGSPPCIEVLSDSSGDESCILVSSKTYKELPEDQISLDSDIDIGVDMREASELPSLGIDMCGSTKAYETLPMSMNHEHSSSLLIGNVCSNPVTADELVGEQKTAKAGPSEEEYEDIVVGSQETKECVSPIKIEPIASFSDGSVPARMNSVVAEAVVPRTCSEKAEDNQNIPCTVIQPEVGMMELEKRIFGIPEEGSDSSLGQTLFALDCCQMLSQGEVPMCSYMESAGIDVMAGTGKMSGSVCSLSTQSYGSTTVTSVLPISTQSMPSAVISCHDKRDISMKQEVPVGNNIAMTETPLVEGDVVVKRESLVENDVIVKEEPLVGNEDAKKEPQMSGMICIVSDDDQLLEPEPEPRILGSLSIKSPYNELTEELSEWETVSKDRVKSEMKCDEDPNVVTVYSLAATKKGQTNARIITKRKADSRWDLPAKLARIIRTVLVDVDVGSIAEVQELAQSIVQAHLECLKIPGESWKTKKLVPTYVTVATQTDELLETSSSAVCQAQSTQTEKLASADQGVQVAKAELSVTIAKDAQKHDSGAKTSCGLKSTRGSKPSAQVNPISISSPAKKSHDAIIVRASEAITCGRGLQGQKPDGSGKGPCAAKVNFRPTSHRAGIDHMTSSMPTRHFGHRKLIHHRAHQQFGCGDLGKEWRDRLQAMLKKRTEVEEELHKMFQQREQRRLARQAVLLGHEEASFSDLEELPADTSTSKQDNSGHIVTSAAELHTCSKSCNLGCDLKKASEGISKLMQAQKKVAQLAQCAVSDQASSEPQPSTSGARKNSIETATRTSLTSTRNTSPESGIASMDHTQPSTSRPKLTRSLSDSSTTGSGTPAAQRERMRKQFVKRALIMTQRCLHRKIIASLREEGKGQGHGEQHQGRGRWRHYDWNDHGPPGWMRHPWRWHKRRAMWHLQNANSPQQGNFPRHHYHHQYSTDDGYPGWNSWTDRKGDHIPGRPGRRHSRHGSGFSPQVGPSMPRRRGRHRKGMQAQRQHSNKMKIDNRNKPKDAHGKKMDKKCRPVFGKTHKLVMIGGTAYRANKMRLERVTNTGKRTRRRSSSQKSPRRRHSVTVGGVRYRLSGGGRRMRRVSSSEAKKGNASQVNLRGVTYIQTRPGSLVRAAHSSAQKVATRSVMRSIATAVNANRKRQSPQYCLFYNRFGKCKRGDKCPYIHDPDKVAVCTRFLRGTCQVTNCPFSHRVAPDKMPVCTHFLRGSCSRDPCPYRHVNVARDAEVCPGFLKGFCPNGEKCKKLHTLVCPEFRATNTCSKGAACKMKHPRKRVPMVKLTPAIPVGDTSPPSAGAPSKVIRLEAAEPMRFEDTDDPSLPWRERTLPSFISLSRSESMDTSSAKATSDAEPLQIRPNFEPPPKS